MNKKNKFLAIILAASMAVSAAPMALADEVTDELLDAIVNAEDASFEAAAEAIIENEETDYEPYSSFELFALKSDGTTFTPAEGYDVVVNDNTFDDETDGYKVSDGSYKAWTGVTFSNNYYASIDFMFTDAAQMMEIRNKTSGGDYGPTFVYNSSRGLSNKTANSGNPTGLYQNFALNKWYKLVLEGRMKVTGAVTYFSLYERDSDGNYTRVVEPTSIYLRNYSSGSNKSNPFLLPSNGVCIDNEYAVHEWPNSVEITEKQGRTTVEAGATEEDALTFTAVAHRTGTEDSNLTQPEITWSLSGVKEGEENLIKIEDGRLTVDALASTQNIKVIATASSNANPKQEYDVAVTALNTTGLKCDTITVSGAETINAGGETTFTFAAAKTGEGDVTGNISAEEIGWKIMDSTGSRQLGNKYITVDDNGKVTVGDAVIGQNIIVRAYLKAKDSVYGDAALTVNTNSKESIVHFNACEDKDKSGYAVINQGSWDGSSYYTQGASGDFIGEGIFDAPAKVRYATTDVLITADMKFMEDGAGFNTVRRDGGTGLFIQRSGGELAYDPNGTPVKLGYALDTDSWYHIEVMFNTSKPSLNIWKYNENGVRTNKATFTYKDGIEFRQSNAFNRITINKNTGIDNYLVVYPNPTELEILDKDGNAFGDEAKTAGIGIGAGIPYSFGIAAYRDGLLIPGFSSGRVGWRVYDSDNTAPVAGNDFSVTAGTLSSYGLTKPQTVYIRAISNDNNAVYGSMKVNIVSSEQFEITGLGYDGGDEKDTNEGKQRTVNKKHLVRLYVNKLGDYRDDVVFIMTLFDGNGKLAGSYSKKTSGKSLQTGEGNEVAIDYNLPAEFDETSWTAKVMAWTSLTTNKDPEELVSNFSANYNNGTITLSNLPALTGKRTIAVYNPGTTDSQLSGDTSERIAYISQSDEEITSTIALSDLAPGTYTVAIGGSMANDSYSVHRATFTVE